MDSPVSATIRLQPVDSRTARLQRLKARRKLWLKVHLWLGLGLGLFLAVIGITGSVLVFWKEIDQALNPGLYTSAAESGGQQRRSLDELFTAAQNSAPTGWQSMYGDAPEQSNGNYLFHFYYETPSEQTENAESLNVAVDPFTAQVVSHRVFYHTWNPLKHSLVGFFFKLHYAMFLGEAGVVAVGILACLLLISVLTGLILWWPLTGKWRRALTIKRRASRERFNHDLHQTCGVYSLLVLLALLISGIYFNLPEQFRWLVNACSPLTEEPAAVGSGNAGLEALLSQAQTDVGGQPLYYALNGGMHNQFTACFKDVSELKPYVLTSRCLVFNRNNGELLQIIDPAHGSAGDVFMQWQWPLHSGQAFGWTGRILVFITGLLCPLLFVTGVIRWLQKRRGKAVMLAKQLN